MILAMLLRQAIVASLVGMLLSTALCSQISSASVAPNAVLKLGPIYSDHMVMPPATTVAVHGSSGAATEVWVTPSWGDAVVTTAAADGRWQVDLQTPKRGTAGSFTVKNEASEIVVADVLIGDVWLASGQSNMEMRVGTGNRGVDNCAVEVKNATYPELRVFTVDRQTSDQPARDVGGQWRVCSPEVAASFSAVGYFFARDLLQAGKGPIGLVVSSWGGTRCEAWTRGAGLVDFPEFQSQLQSLQNGSSEQRMARRRDQFFQAVNKSKPLGKPRKVTLPEVWSQAGLADFDGVVDYSRVVALPVGLRGKSLRLQLGAIDDMDTIFWNGKRVAGSEREGVWSQPRDYVIAAEHTDVETVHLGIRIIDTGGEGGVIGEPSGMSLSIKEGRANEALSLAGAWQRQTVVPLSKLPRWPSSSRGPNRASVLWNGMIEPLLPFPFTGCIWYQGESNRNLAEQYRTLFPAMIKDWRRAFAREVPFYFVQIAPYAYGNDNGQAAALRASQAAALDLPHTGMVVTLDCGDADDIHPKAKQPVGARLALLARADHYGDSIVSRGPRAVAASRDGASVRIRFDSGGSALKIMDQSSHRGEGFAIAGSDGVYHSATVRIEQGDLVAISEGVTEPRSVRYAWSAVPKWSLVNQIGLPAGPFLLEVR